MSFFAAINIAQGVYSGDYSTECNEVLALGKLTEAPDVRDAAGFESTDHLKAIYFDALDWKGKPTKVFAWLGLPANRSGKVPGIVLVHGGGGSAFKEWVEKWNDQGFAAISIAVEGQTDVKDPNSTDRGKSWKQHEWPGPRRSGIYGDSAEPLKDQWMYHAVADTILANSLLRSLPEVDADKVGLMGISWGGVITSTVMGIDDRFAFAIPTYGCGNLSEAENQYGRALGNNEIYKQVWDPILRLDKATMPALWFSWPGDQHFPLDKQASCYAAMTGDHMVSLIPGMRHGHGAGWNPPDSYAFAKSVVGSGTPWCHQTSAAVKGGTAMVSFASSKPLDGAELISTVDTGITGSRKWVESSAKLKRDGDGWKAAAAVPSGTTAWFVNVRCGKLMASSDFQQVL
ncbi:alpha/beta hydrolase family protein [Pontiella sulfatireligans]|uniref:alpha/beta hydrolase family protein n=1 Tax=Pontiella sulfatireligans TaxID=2750658 RepID=UPI001C9E6727|nr:acetylxylan esterase [Pontiella sulfatireligans]